MYKSAFKQTAAAGMTLVLMAVPFIFILFLFKPKLVWAVFFCTLSGRIFSEPWNPVHAGFCMDQPTIGKWYFWFGVLTVMILPYLAMVRQFFAGRTTACRWIFLAGTSLLCVFLVCLLTEPFFWLLQYIGNMGWTSKRGLALLCGLAGYAAVIAFWFWAVRKRVDGPASDGYDKPIELTALMK